jgi:hypothetical protein
MVNESAKYENKTEKLNKIADLILLNFTELYFPESRLNFFPNECGGNIIYNHRFFGHLCSGYGYDKQGKVRARGVNLSNNPIWIASQKTGACEELTELFANVTNRSGFESRSVCPDFDHRWNEVSIDGVWKYYDLTEYHDHKNDLNNEMKWFGNQSEYHKNTGWNFSTVYVCGKDTTYPENNLTLNYTFF